MWTFWVDRPWISRYYEKRKRSKQHVSVNRTAPEPQPMPKEEKVKAGAIQPHADEQEEAGRLALEETIKKFNKNELDQMLEHFQKVRQKYIESHDNEEAYSPDLDSDLKYLNLHIDLMNEEIKKKAGDFDQAKEVDKKVLKKPRTVDLLKQGIRTEKAKIWMVVKYNPDLLEDAEIYDILSVTSEIGEELRMKEWYEEENIVDLLYDRVKNGKIRIENLHLGLQMKYFPQTVPWEIIEDLLKIQSEKREILRKYGLGYGAVINEAERRLKEGEIRQGGISPWIKVRFLREYVTVEDLAKILQPGSKEQKEFIKEGGHITEDLWNLLAQKVKEDNIPQEQLYQWFPMPQLEREALPKKAKLYQVQNPIALAPNMETVIPDQLKAIITRKNKLLKSVQNKLKVDKTMPVIPKKYVREHEKIQEDMQEIVIQVVHRYDDKKNEVDKKGMICMKIEDELLLLREGMMEGKGNDTESKDSQEKMANAEKIEALRKQYRIIYEQYERCLQEVIELKKQIKLTRYITEFVDNPLVEETVAKQMEDVRSGIGKEPTHMLLRKAGKILIEERRKREELSKLINENTYEGDEESVEKRHADDLADMLGEFREMDRIGEPNCFYPKDYQGKLERIIQVKKILDDPGISQWDQENQVKQTEWWNSLKEEKRRYLSELGLDGIRKQVDRLIQSKTDKIPLTQRGIQQLQYAMKHFPLKWRKEYQKTAPNDLSYRVEVGYGKRGSQSDSEENQVQRIKMSKGGLSTAFHEKTHNFESTVPKLYDIEHIIYKIRTLGVPLTQLGRGYGKEEKARMGCFPISDYMGKEYYTNHHEIVSMGFEYAYTNPEELKKDPELEEFIYGLLALV